MIRNFMIVFGLQSTLFDFLTFFILYYVFHSTHEEFRTGWFLECIGTELVILMSVRTRKAFYKDIPGRYLLLMSLLVGMATVIVVYSPVREWFGFIPPSPALLSSMLLIILFYGLTAEITKSIFFKRHP